MRYLVRGVWPVLGLVFATCAQAKEEEFKTKAIVDKPAIFLDPVKAYILVESQYPTYPALIRIPTKAEREKDRKDRAEKLAEEHAKWERTAGSENRPEEPTEETFEWPDYEQRHMALLGPHDRFAKKGASLYLQEVPPGEYALYGIIGVGPNGSIGGICACMGTVSFQAEAGKVTAFKVGLPYIELMLGKDKSKRPKDVFSLGEGITTMSVMSTSEAAKDSRIPGEKFVQAQFRPAGRFPNWVGGEVERLMPIEGVFRYDRDKIIDLTGSTTAPAK